MTVDEAIQVLDWVLGAACLQVTCEPRKQPSLSLSLDDALEVHFAYLRQQAPVTHLAVLALLDGQLPARVVSA